MDYIFDIKKTNKSVEDKQRKIRILVDGISSFEQAHKILEKIKEIKEDADKKGTFDGMYNPNDWNNYDWYEKIEIVCDYVSDKEDFEIVIPRPRIAEINID